MEREQIGKGYYALDVDAATPTTAVAEDVKRAFRAAFAIPIRTVTAADDLTRRALSRRTVSRRTLSDQSPQL